MSGLTIFAIIVGVVVGLILSFFAQYVQNNALNTCLDEKEPAKLACENVKKAADSYEQLELWKFLFPILLPIAGYVGIKLKDWESST